MTYHSCELPEAVEMPEMQAFGTRTARGAAKPITVECGELRKNIARRLRLG
jgi:hypothetical protein